MCPKQAKEAIFDMFKNIFDKTGHHGGSNFVNDGFGSARIIKTAYSTGGSPNYNYNYNPSPQFSNIPHNAAINSPALRTSQNLIAHIAKLANVPVNIAEGIVGAESGFRSNAKNPGSSASGYYQITNDTWLDLVKKYGKYYNIGVKDKTNPVAQAIMGTLYTKDTISILHNLGISKPTGAEIYAGELLGHNDLNKFVRTYLSAPNTKAAVVFPRAARYNPQLFYDNGRPLTIQELYNEFEKRMVANTPTQFMHNKGPAISGGPSINPQYSNIEYGGSLPNIYGVPIHMTDNGLILVNS